MTDQDFIVRGFSTEQAIPKSQLGEYILDRIRHFGDKVAQIFPQIDRTLTFADIVDRSVSVAIELKSQGVQKGDVIVVLSENCPEFTYILLGSLLIGSFLAPVNTSLDEGDMKRMLEILSPRIIFANPSQAAFLQGVADSSIDIVTLAEDFTSWQSFLNHSNNNNGDFTPERSFTLEEHTGVIMSSSGTTGLPKGVQLSHANLHYMLQFLRKNDEPVASNDVTMTVSPMFWMSGFINILLGLDSGNTVLVHQRFDPESLLRDIEKYKVNVVSLGPSQVVAVAKFPDVGKYDASSLRFVGFGGAPMSRAMKELAEEKLDKILMSVYGMTEIMLAIFPGAKSLDKPESCGTVGRNAMAKIIDLETGKALGPNQEGELCLKAPTIMLGYYNNPEATADTIDSEGWLHTGDVGYYDEDNYFYIYDRIKELIKYKGHSIWPSELEDVLLTHPDVKEATVISVHHDLDQEHAMAFVVREPGSTVTEEELTELIKSKLSQNKWLHGGVKFIDTIPQTASGKTKRRELRALVQSSAGIVIS